jgi:hypothetical protein
VEPTVASVAASPPDEELAMEASEPLEPPDEPPLDEAEPFDPADEPPLEDEPLDP